jgi:hypothetical protein
MFYTVLCGGGGVAFVIQKEHLKHGEEGDFVALFQAMMWHMLKKERKNVCTYMGDM